VACDRLPLSFGGVDYTRPYYRIHREDEIVADTGSEEYFYDVLNNTADRALEDSGLSGDEIERCALFFGSTAIDIPLYEARYRQSGGRENNIFSSDSPGYGKIAHSLSLRLGMKGPCYTFTTACTSTANALIYAAAMIGAGMIERALVVGYDLYNDLGFFGFESLILITPDPCRPFDKNRRGIIMGEACGALCSIRPGEGGAFAYWAAPISATPTT
jgi:3-oxoacyl-[acyl-carrier-protein] synthase-1